MGLVPLKQAPVQQCSQHNKPLEVHRSLCDEFICHLCTASKLHCRHEYEPIADAFEKQQKIIISSLVVVIEKLASLSRVVKGLESQEKEVLEQGKAIKSEIHSRVQQLIQASNTPLVCILCPQYNTRYSLYRWVGWSTLHIFFLLPWDSNWSPLGYEPRLHQLSYQGTHTHCYLYYHLYNLVAC